MTLRVTILHNHYRGTIPSGENLSVDQHQDLVGDAAELTVVGARNPVGRGRRVATGARFAESSVDWPPATSAWVERVLATDPDVIHIENLTPFIPEAVVGRLASSGVPVVRRWRNFRFRCPSGNNFRDGHQCFSCEGHLGRVPAIVHRCYGNSFAASGLVALRRGMLAPDDIVHVPVSTFVGEALAVAGVPAPRIRTIPNWVPASRHPVVRSRSERAPEVLFLGSIAEKKGISVLVGAWRKLQAAFPELRLSILGDGPMHEEVVGLGHDLRLTVEPAIGYEDARARIAGAVAVVVPSTWSEPFGRVAAEAMAEGTPVVVSDAGGLPGIVGESCGRVFRAGRADDLERALREILELDPSAYAELATSGRRRYLDHYSPEAVRGSWLDLYEAVQNR